MNAQSGIIGGMFGLADAASGVGIQPPFIDHRSVFLANARSGIAVLIELLTPPCVWVPSYLCDAVVKAVSLTAQRMRFYGVDYDLQVTRQWLAEVSAGDLVILIDYFGFPCDRSVAALAREKRAWVLEDASQALLSTHVGDCADFVLYSPRKFLGVPDGGVLNSKCEIDLRSVRLQEPPADWWLKALSASVFRREFDRFGGRRLWFRLFRQTDAEAPVGHYAMSQLSKLLLLRCFDYVATARARIDNHGHLHQRLSKISLFQRLSPGTVPLGYPIRSDRRNQLRATLFENEIYPPVHWQIADFVPMEFVGSHELADSIMTLPCDQRYGRDDMERISGLILKDMG